MEETIAFIIPNEELKQHNKANTIKVWIEFIIPNEELKLIFGQPVAKGRPKFIIPNEELKLINCFHSNKKYADL